MNSLPLPPARDELSTRLSAVERLAAAWLVEYRGHTRAAYVRDLQAWSEFCAERDVDLMLASRAMVAAYADQLQDFRLGRGYRQPQALRSDGLLSQRRRTRPDPQ